MEAKRQRPKRAFLCFDEWNVWYKTFGREHMNGQGKAAPHLIEEVYNLEDALVVAGFLNSFIRHADVVKIANLAQVVNVIAPILTRGDELLKQSIYYAFQMFSQRGEGRALRQVCEGPGYTSESYGDVSYADTSAILNGDCATVFAVNRHGSEALPLAVEVADRGIRGLREAVVLTGPDAQAANSFEEPDVITTRGFDRVDLRSRRALATIPPLSAVALAFELG